MTNENDTPINDAMVEAAEDGELFGGGGVAVGEPLTVEEFGELVADMQEAMDDTDE